ncbi:DUF4352 domain-containing protein [Rhodococcus pyridinivorans]|uniref:DUF4352 domain-containing protein n=1 Tax=Rhodococcus pyridinivorans TaxID=103816 RepID=UPI001FFF6012|nr:DUF4352 domain-containing protein [Rhodococcus pyridinivorans]UPK64677.1 DUF4352 domain-containing protein [Rhodococcus pyridinivorans]
MNPPAGWHPDPANPNLERYWDGQQWTSQTQPRGQLPPAPLAAPVVGKKKPKWPWAVLTVLVLFIIAVNSGEDTSSTSRTSKPSGAATTTSSAPTSERADEVLPGIGMPVRDGKLEFVVHSWDDATSTASITVTNIGDAPQYFATSNQYLIDNQGRKFEGEYDWRSELSSMDLNPGQSVSGDISFVLSGATAARMEFHDSMFSMGTEMSLR